MHAAVVTVVSESTCAGGGPPLGPEVTCGRLSDVDSVFSLGVETSGGEAARGVARHSEKPFSGDWVLAEESVTAFHKKPEAIEGGICVCAVVWKQPAVDTAPGYEEAQVKAMQRNLPLTVEEMELPRAR